MSVVNKLFLFVLFALLALQVPLCLTEDNGSDNDDFVKGDCSFQNCKSIALIAANTSPPSTFVHVARSESFIFQFEHDDENAAMRQTTPYFDVLLLSSENGTHQKCRLLWNL